MSPLRLLTLLALFAAAACGDGAPPPADAGPAATRRAAASAPDADRPSAAVEGDDDGDGPSEPARPRVDTRARLDVTGAPDGVVLELDGQELAGVVLLPPGKRTVQVYAEDIWVGHLDIELHAGRVTVPDLSWVAEKLAAARRHLRIHSHDVKDPGLDWLDVHRSADGLWSAERFADLCPADARCDGSVPGIPDALTTGAALLAYLGYGEQLDVGQHRRVVRGALDALVRRQDAAGRLDPDPLAHAVATAALTELCADTETVRFRQPAQRAVDALLGMRRAGRGWARDGAPDAEATAWGALVVASARDARLALPEGITAGLLPDLAMFGELGGTQIDDRPAALLTLARLALGCPADDAAVVSGLGRILRKPPVAGEPVDPERLWAATAVVFLVGGRDAWKRWDEAVERAFLPRVDSSSTLFAHGPSDVLGEAGLPPGRVRAVAFAELVIGIHYRWGRVFGVTRR